MHHDVIIIGAGPAGLCLAKALCDLELKVALVERQPRAAIAEPAFDGREIALTHASMRLLRDLGIWQHLPDDACSPLRAAKIASASPSGTVVSASPCTSSVGHLTLRMVLTGAMSSNRAPITFCT